jgi:hemerythrin-like domain-containing protein
MTTSSAERVQCDTSDMVVVHRVFRREFELLPHLVRSVELGDTARAALVATHAAELIAALHHHHTGEDELLWPKLGDRVTFQASLIERMELQHERIADLLRYAGQLLPRWRVRPTADLQGSLAETLAEVGDLLNEHLSEEEQAILPIAQRHITQQEWAELGQRGIASLPKERLLSFLGAILEEATPDERTEFLARVPLAGRIGYRLVGQRRYLREVVELRGPLADRLGVR